MQYQYTNIHKHCTCTYIHTYIRTYVHCTCIHCAYKYVYCTLTTQPTIFSYNSLNSCLSIHTEQSILFAHFPCQMSGSVYRVSAGPCFKGFLAIKEYQLKRMIIVLMEKNMEVIHEM